MTKFVKRPVPAASAHRNGFHTPAGRPVPRGPLVTSWDDQLKAVSTGAAAIATVAEAAHFYPWPNLVFIPIRDAPAVEWALAWRTATESPLIRAFAAAVTQPRPREA